MMSQSSGKQTNTFDVADPILLEFFQHSIINTPNPQNFKKIEIFDYNHLGLNQKI